MAFWLCYAWSFSASACDERYATGEVQRPQATQLESLPVVLPRFSEELEAVKRMPTPKNGMYHPLSGQYGTQQVPGQEAAPQILESKV